MTPKEKAKELIDKYYDHVDSNFSDEATQHTAKQCALICVEEIISITPMYTGNLNPKWKYWHEVSKEIQNL